MNTKENSIKRRLSNLESLAIAFSGGVDSSLLATLAHKYVQGRVLLINAKTPFGTKKESQFIKKWTKKNNYELISFNVDVLNIKEIQNNPYDRCYYCKKALMQKILLIAKKQGITTVADGANFDDLSDFRPGNKASNELGIIHPFIEAKLTKKDIRNLAKKYKLENHDLPAQACLATRIPPNTPILNKDLRQIEKAEEFLHDIGYFSCRIRKFGNLAKIEVQKKQIKKLLSNSEILSKHLKKLGFKHIALDIDGYRQGAMN